MGYLHIDNLYKNQTILMFRECYALEKIHGTSAHIAWKDGRVRFFSGGEKHDRFVLLFTQDLPAMFAELGHDDVVIYGEAYGGKQQGQRHRYGDAIRFVAFDVQIGGMWLEVPNAADVCSRMGIEFAHYRLVSTDLASLDAERDAPSEQARRNGVAGDQTREGVVLRPLMELTDKRGNRIIAKHKRPEFSETKTPREVDPEKAALLTLAASVADEWVTPMRLDHVLDKLRVDGAEVGMDRMREVIAAMQEDVTREGAGEVDPTRDTMAAIGRKTAELFAKRLRSAIGSA